MDIKTQKVIDKLVLEGDCLLTCFEDKYLQNSFGTSGYFVTFRTSK